MCGFGLAFLHQPNNIKAVKMILIGFVNDLKFFHFIIMMLLIYELTHLNYER